MGNGARTVYPWKLNKGLILNFLEAYMEQRLKRDNSNEDKKKIIIILHPRNSDENWKSYNTFPWYYIGKRKYYLYGLNKLRKVGWRIRWKRISQESFWLMYVELHWMDLIGTVFFNEIINKHNLEAKRIEVGHWSGLVLLPIKWYVHSKNILNARRTTGKRASPNLS